MQGNDDEKKKWKRGESCVCACFEEEKKQKKKKSIDEYESNGEKSWVLKCEQFVYYCSVLLEFFFFKVFLYRLPYAKFINTLLKYRRFISTQFALNDSKDNMCVCVKIIENNAMRQPMMC